MEQNDLYEKGEGNGLYKPLKNVLIVFCLSCHIIIVATNHTGPTFFNYTPSFKCKGYEGLDPCNIRGNGTIHAKTEKNVSYPNMNETSYLNRNETCPSRYEYYGRNDEINIVTEWNLVCNRRIYNALSVTCYFIAVAIGSVISGIMNDKYGRKFTTYLCIYTQSIMVVLQSTIAHSYLMYNILRFAQGLFMQGILTGTSLLINEIMSNVHRIVLNGILEVFWGVGLIFLAICALFFTNWRILNIIVCSVPLVISMCSVWFIPESKVWIESRKSLKEMNVYKQREKLYTNVNSERNKMLENETSFVMTANEDKTGEVIISEEAEKNCQKKMENNANVEPTEKEELLNQKDKDNHFHKCNSVFEMNCTEKSAESSNLTTQIKTLFSVTVLLKRLMLMLLLWFTQTVSYYGITYTIPTLAGDHYINFIIGAFVEILFFVVVGVAAYKFGRRLTLSFSYFGSAICFLLIVALPMELFTWAGKLKTSLAVFGKGCVIGDYICIILYSMELFPTPLRGLSLGLSTFCALIGTIIAPLIIQLNYYTSLNIPFLIFAVLNFLCSILGFMLLPETKDSALPKTVDEALLLT